MAYLVSTDIHIFSIRTDIGLHNIQRKERQNETKEINLYWRTWLRNGSSVLGNWTGQYMEISVSCRKVRRQCVFDCIHCIGVYIWICVNDG